MHFTGGTGILRGKGSFIGEMNSFQVKGTLWGERTTQEGKWSFYGKRDFFMVKGQYKGHLTREEGTFNGEEGISKGEKALLKKLGTL